MAWQHAGSMGGNGGNPAASNEAGNSANQPQGTEYTLQGMENETDSFLNVIVSRLTADVQV